MTEPACYVVVHHPSAGRVRLCPGDLVGRLRDAALHLEHPSVSEVHAYVSLRDGALKLLSLRGGLAVGGRVVREVTLANDQEITLAVGHTLTVLEVANPATLLALEGPDGRTEVLAGQAVSLVAGEGRVAGFVERAEVTLWTDGAGWTVGVVGQRPRPLRVGERLRAGAEAWLVVEVPSSESGVARTLQGARLDAPLRLEGWFDTVHVHREGAPTFVLAGAAARLLCELGAIGQPVGWATVGRVLWPEEEDTDRLRRRWDVLLIRLRRKLAAEAVRTDLVHSDGTGNVRLLLQPDDRYLDRS